MTYKWEIGDALQAAKRGNHALAQRIADYLAGKLPPGQKPSGNAPPWRTPPTTAASGSSTRAAATPQSQSARTLGRAPAPASAPKRRRSMRDPVTGKRVNIKYEAARGGTIKAPKSPPYKAPAKAKAPTKKASPRAKAPARRSR